MNAIVARIVVALLVLLVGTAAAYAASRRIVAGLVTAGVMIVLAFGAEAGARRARVDRLVWGVVGGVVGLGAGAVFATGAGVLGPYGLALPSVSILLGLYLGVTLGVARGPELAGINAWLFPPVAATSSAKLVDTSAIIDGRLGDLASTGFVEGPLVVPQFVLRELQQIADSTDPRKRSRGKRGFEVVQRLQRLPRPLVEIDDDDVPGVTGVDEKLLTLARTRAAKIITTDYNLNKLAELRGVTVLNVNELANALKPALVAGEPMQVDVLREGKEAGQGVAYLDDGTMIVVEQGKRWIGQRVDVAVTSVLQTPSGRIIFTRLRDDGPTRA